ARCGANDPRRGMRRWRASRATEFWLWMSSHINTREFIPTKESCLTMEEKIRQLAATYAETLKKRIDTRIDEMNSDDDSHRLVYQILGVSDEEGRLIDSYQNKGRFL